MIRFESVDKRFQPLRPGAAPVVALRGVSLEIPAGGVWAVVGPNGAGKTTLFSLLLGFLHPDAGSISVDELAPREHARRRGFAYLPERFDLPPGLTPRAALHAFARLEGLDARAARAAVARELERYDLSAVADRPARALSRGLMQRTGLAQTGLAARAVVVLDEPTQGLDPIWRVRLRERVAELRQEGRTILLASHELDEVQRLADRAVLLDGGGLRQVVELTPVPGEPLRYRLALAHGVQHVRTAFPGATATADAKTFDIAAADEVDLTRRLAALVELGGVIAAVHPRDGRLEREFRVDRPADPEAS